MGDDSLAITEASTIGWRAIRRTNSTAGIPHIVFQQTVQVPNVGVADVQGAQLVASYAKALKPGSFPFPGFCTYPDKGRLSVSGSYATDLWIPNRQLTTKESAWRAAAGPEFSLKTTWMAGVQVKDARLLLEGATSQPQLTWEVQVPGVDGLMIQARVDAGSGDVLSREATWSNSGFCEAEVFGGVVSPLTANSEGVFDAQEGPVFDCPTCKIEPLPNPLPTGFAVPHPFRPDSRYQAVNREVTPNVEIYMGLDHANAPSDGRCLPWPHPGDASYSVMYLEDQRLVFTENADLVRADPSFENGVPGHLATDAMRNTITTMNALKTFWEMGNTEDSFPIEVARVVVEASGDHQARMMNPDWGLYVPGISVWGPPDSVMLGPVGEGTQKSPGYVLDLVAHEWFHAIIAKTTAIDVNGVDLPGGGFDPSSGEINEGAADVIGKMVEGKLLMDLGLPLDWDMFTSQGRDRVHPVRSAMNCEGRDALEYSMHKDDDVNFSNVEGARDLHQKGNKLLVAFRLAALGGDHPCKPTGNDIRPLGFDGAGRVFWDLFTSKVSSVPSWDDLPRLAMEATFDIYNSCGLCETMDGRKRQIGIRQSFEAIGYDAPDQFKKCDGTWQPWSE